VPQIPDDLDLPPQQTLTFAQQLLDDGLAFNAHEVLESAWKNGPFAEKMLWQALAQYAVGITHLQRGNPKGARTLLTRAIRRLEAYLRGDSSPTTEFPYDIDGPGIIAHAQQLLDALDRDAPITDADLAATLCLPRRD